MSSPRIFVPFPLQIKQKVVLDAAASKHLLQVLKLRLNDSVVIFNNSVGEFQAVITNISKRQAEVAINNYSECNNESPIKIHLGQGISRREKMDFTIQKSVELGVYSITPLFTEHCNVKLEGERLEKRLRHWQNVAISAAEQSGRCYVPKILPAKNLVPWCESHKSQLKIVLDPQTVSSFKDIKESPTEISILVGPEGGLSDQEIDNARENNFLPVALGPRILRTETAALAAISVLQAKWGDFG